MSLNFPTKVDCFEIIKIKARENPHSRNLNLTIFLASRECPFEFGAKFTKIFLGFL